MKKRAPRIQTAQCTSSDEKPTSMSGNGIWQRIALKAYELYEQRGRHDGYALEDWLRAEAIVGDKD